MQQRFNQIVWGLNFIFLVSFFVIMAQYVLSVLGQWGSDKFFQQTNMHLLKGKILEDAFQIGLICFGLILFGVYVYTYKLVKNLRSQVDQLALRPSLLQKEKEAQQNEFNLNKIKLLEEISELQTKLKGESEQKITYHQGVNNFCQEVRNITNEFCQINLSNDLELYFNGSNVLWDENEVQNQIYLMESLKDRIMSLNENYSELELLTFNMNVELNEYACMHLHSSIDSQLDGKFGNYTMNSKKILESSARILENTKKLLTKNEEYLKDLVEHLKESKSKTWMAQEKLQKDLTHRINSVQKIREKLQSQISMDMDPVFHSIGLENEKALGSSTLHSQETLSGLFS